MEVRYNKLNEFYKQKFGERTLKICVDGGFSCPNRDGKVSFGGCIFCSEHGSGELIKNASSSIKKQIQEYLNSYRAGRADSFIVYLQNFSGTYDTVENLKEKYDSCYIDKRIKGISIATRPDCITEEIVKLIASYKEKGYVSVELGLQTVNEQVAKKLNRSYKNNVFEDALNLLNKYDIDVIVHIMCGLPFEDRAKYYENEKIYDNIFSKEVLEDGKLVTDDIIEITKYLNNKNISGVKIHSTYVAKNTRLCSLYLNNEYKPLEIDEYLEYLVYIITHLNKKIVVHRICGDSPKNILVAPEWNLHKKIILNKFDKIMNENKLSQGIFIS